MNNKQFEYIGDGRNRSVYRHGNYVVKLPLNDYGMSDNCHEYSIWRQYGYTKGYAAYARCRLIKNSCILVMEYARYIVDSKTLECGCVPYNMSPNWAGCIDCNQVGYNRKGVLVAYDYGRH